MAAPPTVYLEIPGYSGAGLRALLRAVTELVGPLEVNTDLRMIRPQQISMGEYIIVKKRESSQEEVKKNKTRVLE